MPVTGPKYLRLVGTGSNSLPPGGLLPRPAPPTLNEIRVAIPGGTKEVSFAYEFIVRDIAAFNDGMDISVVDVNGNLVANVASADIASSNIGAPSTGAFCSQSGGSPLLPPGPETAIQYLPVVPYPAYLSIVCWNGGDDGIPSAVHVDAIHFWGMSRFQLAITAPFGPGSVRLQNSQGVSFAPYWTAVTLSPGAFPNGWLYGLDITVGDLLNEVSFGPPFSGTLDSSGGSTFTIPSGVPPGLVAYAVSINFGPTVTASSPVSFLTL
jgi:hypothetical protein